MWANFYDAIFDAAIDCLKVIPILFLAYLLVAYLSHDHNHKFYGFLSKNKKTSVLYASFLGCIPQCGFSSVIADLYSRQKVTLGTLVAVFVATSDEALPIMIATPNKILDLLLLIAIKIVLALIWGYSVDFVVGLIEKVRKRRKAQKAQQTIAVDGDNISTEKNLETSLNAVKSEKTENESTHVETFEEHMHSHHNHECGHIHTDECSPTCHHSHGDCCVDNIFLDAFKHTFEIAIYIFVATFIINLIVNYFTLDAIQMILTDNVYIQILIASLVGLIPNCASSVLLVELYVMGGVLSFPALVAGLSTGAGVGLFILISKNRKHPFKSLGILCLQFIIGVISGIFLTIFF